MLSLPMWQQRSVRKPIGCSPALSSDGKKGQRPPCHRCSIFLHHQQIKYDWTAPLAFFAPPVFLFLGWERYQAYYGKVVQWLNELWKHIAFTPPSGL